MYSLMASKVVIIQLVNKYPKSFIKSRLNVERLRDTNIIVALNKFFRSNSCEKVYLSRLSLGHTITRRDKWSLEI